MSLSRASHWAIAMLVALFLASVLAKLGIIGPHYNTVNEALSFSAPSANFWLGNDIFGRDILARGLHGAFTAFAVGFFAACLSTVLGTALGLLSGYFEGWIDEVIVSVLTVLESIPYILLLAAIAFVVGQGLVNVYISLGLTSWVVLCRLVRTECRRQKESDYVLAAKSYGMSNGRILFHHILPNVAHIIAVQFVIVFVFAIKAEVILTYLGLGVEPGYPSWGYMFDEARQELVKGFWWNFIGATFLMGVLVFALNTLLTERRKR